MVAGVLDPNRDQIINPEAALGNAISSGTVTLGQWNYVAGGGAPIDGQITFDNADPLLATVVNISDKRDDDGDMTSILEQILPDSLLYVRVDDDAFVVISVSTINDNGTYFTYGISSIDAGPQSIVAPAPVFIAFDGGAGDIVPRVNSELGNVWWQQGITNAIFVRDFSEDSPELAPYLNGGTGEWDLPDRALMVVDTTAQSLESVIERDINALGDLFISPSVRGGEKGITMTTGVGTATNAIKTSAGGTILIGDVSLVSDDASRGFFGISDAGNFFYQGTLLALPNIGTLNAANIRILDASVLGVSVPATIGAKCDFFRGVDLIFGTGFLGSSNDIFDLTTAPTSGERELDFQNCNGNVNPAGKAIFLIDQDNGENIGKFTNCVLDTGGSGEWMRAANDATFDANPQQSLYFNFQVDNWALTQRIGEIYLNDNQVTTFSAANTPTDIIGNYVLAGDTSGFSMSVDGELTYDLTEDAVYDVTFMITGNKQGGGTVDYEILPLFDDDQGGGYVQVQKSDGVDTIDIDDSISATPGDFVKMSYEFSQRFNAQNQKLKHQIQNLINTDTWTTNKIFWIVKKVA